MKLGRLHFLSWELNVLPSKVSTFSSPKKTASRVITWVCAPTSRRTSRWGRPRPRPGTTASSSSTRRPGLRRPGRGRGRGRPSTLTRAGRRSRGTHTRWTSAGRGRYRTTAAGKLSIVRRGCEKICFWFCIPCLRVVLRSHSWSFDLQSWAVPRHAVLQFQYLLCFKIVYHEFCRQQFLFWFCKIYFKTIRIYFARPCRYKYLNLLYEVYLETKIFDILNI